jgi:hypothetical protein
MKINAGPEVPAEKTSKLRPGATRRTNKKKYKNLKALC